jgi:hypothetical protein
MEQFRVAIRTREIYRSPNGDRWLLARDPNTGRVFVTHEPNLPSGGQVADIEIGAFLIAAGNGPEKQAPAPDWNVGLGIPPVQRQISAPAGHGVTRPHADQPRRPERSPTFQGLLDD